VYRAGVENDRFLESERIGLQLSCDGIFVID
jgi:hypothetical protein